MNHCVSKLLFWRQKWVTSAPHGNSLVVRRVSPGRITVMLFWTKYAALRQIKPGILKLPISRGQKNLCIAFVFLAAKKKAVIVSFSSDPKILTADRTAGSAAVCKVRFYSVNSPNKNSLSLMRSNLIGHTIFLTSENVVWRIRSLIRYFSLVT